MDYFTRNWVILKLTSPKETFYKILASFGTFDWRMNSGVTSYEIDGDLIRFYGYSGSCYVCHKDTEELSLMTEGVYNDYKSLADTEDGYDIEIVKFKDIEEKYLIKDY